MTVQVELLAPDAAPVSGPFPRALRLRDGPAASFLPVLPSSEEAWDAALREARRTARPVPDALAEVLAERQHALGAGAQAVRNARALAEPGTLAVVTGQQPGLLGGLLLAFHKAAGAIHLARRLDGRGGGRVVPVFWLASEDHDLDEANRLFVMDRQGQSRRLGLDRVPDGRSLFHLDVTEAEASGLLEETARLLPETERSAETLARVARPQGADLATWCAVSFLRLLGETGLVVLEPDRLLPFAGDALARLAEEAGPIRSAMQATGTALVGAGLPAPLEVQDDYVPLFLRDDPRGPRRKLRATASDELRFGDGTSAGRTDEVARRLRDRPDLGSGDAAGRVFVQDRLLPVLAYVGGPTELAYHAQVRAAHDAVGLPYPLAVPRPAATWVDGRTERNAEAFGQTAADLLATTPFPERPPATVLSEDEGFEALLTGWRTHVLEFPEDLVRWAGSGKERLAALDRAVQRLGGAWERAADGIRAIRTRERGVDAARWRRIQEALRPRGRPQERALSAVSLVARYGEDDFRAGLESLDPLARGHHLVHLG